jgi:hypothetical protein
MAKDCNCEFCKMSNRIKAEWENMSLTTQAIVDDLFSHWECEATDAEYWKMRAHNQWPDHNENEPTPEGCMRPLGETSAMKETPEASGGPG